MSKSILSVVALVALAACGDPKVELQVPLAVVNVSPHDGATSIDPAAVPTVCFNQDMDSATAGSAVVLEEEDAGAVAGQSLSTAASPRCLGILHDALKAETGYVIRVKQGLPAADGSTSFAADVSSRFRTGK